MSTLGEQLPPQRERAWKRAAADLALGARFAVSGGREGWVRMTLTGVGVGLGVALLLLCTALPNVFAARHRVEEARFDNTFVSSDKVPPKADDTFLIADTDTTWHDDDIRGRLVEPEGRRAPLPPGVDGYPAKGEMVVSPALRDLLASDGAALLRARLPYEITGTIGESGLIGSHELAYYAGASGLNPTDGSPVHRLNRYGRPDSPDPSDTASEETDPVLLLMILVVFVVLLAPVAVFIAAAVRFGGERRDRRLAALRLIGSDSRMTRRIAAGEALAGALLGLVVGAGFFLLGRQTLGSTEVLGVSVWPGYLDPSPRSPRWSRWRSRSPPSSSRCSRCAASWWNRSASCARPGSAAAGCGGDCCRRSPASRCSTRRSARAATTATTTRTSSPAASCCC